MKPPDRIYLQWYGQDNDEEPEYITDDITWHSDRVFDNDVEYAQAAAREAAECERAEIRKDFGKTIFDVNRLRDELAQVRARNEHLETLLRNALAEMESQALRANMAELDLQLERELPAPPKEEG